MGALPPPPPGFLEVQVLNALGVFCGSAEFKEVISERRVMSGEQKRAVEDEADDAKGMMDIVRQGVGHKRSKEGMM